MSERELLKETCISTSQRQSSPTALGCIAWSLRRSMEVQYVRHGSCCFLAYNWCMFKRKINQRRYS